MTPQEAKEFRESRQLTQQEMADLCGKSLKTYTNFETNAKTTLATAAAVRDAILAASNASTYRPPNVSVLNTGVTGITKKLSMWALDRKNLMSVGEELLASRHPISYDVSREIVWDSTQNELKNDLAIFQEKIDLLLKGPDQTTDRKDGFLGVVGMLEARQRTAQEFAKAVPDRLLGRIYGAFVTAKYSEDGSERDVSAFQMVLGKINETWILEFHAPSNKALIDQAREFNELKLDVS